MTDERKEQWVVIDYHGNPWGTFDSAREAHEWAEKKWGVRSDHLWNVTALRSPDEP